MTDGLSPKARAFRAGICMFRGHRFPDDAQPTSWASNWMVCGCCGYPKHLAAASQPKTEAEAHGHH